MAMFDKLKFWKKDDDFGKDSGFGDGKGSADFGAGTGKDLGNDDPFRSSGIGSGDPFGKKSSETDDPYRHSFSKEDTDISIRGPGFEHGDHGASEQRFGAEGPLKYAPLQQQPQRDEMMSKDLELINAKLDAIRATIENMNQRMGAIERANADRTRKQW